MYYSGYNQTGTAKKIKKKKEKRLAAKATILCQPKESFFLLVREERQ